MFHRGDFPDFSARACHRFSAEGVTAKEKNHPQVRRISEEEEQNMATPDWVEEGQTAPDFTLKDDKGAEVTLSKLRGKPVVLYFYPADDTPGCTKEACAFRDSRPTWSGSGAHVFGLSPDDVASHAKFRDKYQLNFPLLADLDHKVADAYGAWREKNMYGKVSMGIARSTFVIDAHGKVAKVWKAVQVDGHDQKVIEALAALS